MHKNHHRNLQHPVDVIAVSLTRVEGHVAHVEIQASDHPKGTDLLATANSLLHTWSLSAPKDRSYDKCEITVRWRDGETYQSRYNLKHYSAGKPDLTLHINQGLTWLATKAPIQAARDAVLDFLMIPRQGIVLMPPRHVAPAKALPAPRPTAH